MKSEKKKLIEEIELLMNQITANSADVKETMDGVFKLTWAVIEYLECENKKLKEAIREMKILS